MNHNIETKKFSIDLNANDGALLRVFSLIERRGHRIISMHSFMPTPTTFRMEVEIEAGTPRQDVLIHQVKRLAEVIDAIDISAAELAAGMQANVLRYSRHDMMYEY